MTERTPRLPLVALTTLLAFMPSAPALGNYVSPLPLPELAKRSDLVVVGEVVGTGCTVVKTNEMFQCAVVGVETRLKGECPERIEVITVGEFPEEDTGPLQLHHQYVLFLIRLKNGLFDATRGLSSVYEISPLH